MQRDLFANMSNQPRRQAFTMTSHIISTKADVAIQHAEGDKAHIELGPLAGKLNNADDGQAQMMLTQASILKTWPNNQVANILKKIEVTIGAQAPIGSARHASACDNRFCQQVLQFALNN